jgi:hypothetical protein
MSSSAAIRSIAGPGVLALLLASCAGDLGRPAPGISYTGACSPCQTNADCRIKFDDDDLLCYGLPDWGAGVGLCAHLRQDLPLCASRGDGGPGSDAVTDRSLSDSEAGERVVARGRFSAEPVVSVAGEAELVDLGGGAWEIRFNPDFNLAPRPNGAVRVVITRRSNIGSSIEPTQGDMDLGDLQAASGAQAYPIPSGYDNQRRLWIFSVDQSRALAWAELQDI